MVILLLSTIITPPPATHTHTHNAHRHRCDTQPPAAKLFPCPPSALIKTLFVTESQ